MSMYGPIKHSVNSQLGTPLDVPIGQQNAPAATQVNNATSLMGYAKGIFTRANNADTRTAAIQGHTQMMDGRLTVARANLLDRLNRLPASGDGVRVNFRVQRVVLVARQFWREVNSWDQWGPINTFEHTVETTVVNVTSSALDRSFMLVTAVDVTMHLVGAVVPPPNQPTFATSGNNITGIRLQAIGGHLLASPFVNLNNRTAHITTTAHCELHTFF